MGEVADDLIDGNACSYCGIYFIEEHGFPVVCIPCYKTWKRENKKGKKKFMAITGLQVATIEEA